MWYCCDGTDPRRLFLFILPHSEISKGLESFFFVYVYMDTVVISTGILDLRF